MLEFDFQHLLHIDLEASAETLTWRRFLVLMAGLFGSEKSLLRNHFRPTPDPAEKPPTPEE